MVEEDTSDGGGVGMDRSHHSSSSIFLFFFVD